MKALQQDTITHAHRFVIRGRVVGKTLYFLLIVACMAATFDSKGDALTTSDAAVLHWNEVAVKAVGSTPPFPSTRAMAIAQVAVFEAANAQTWRLQYLRNRSRSFRWSRAAIPLNSAVRPVALSMRSQNRATTISAAVRSL